MEDEKPEDPVAEDAFWRQGDRERIINDGVTYQSTGNGVPAAQKEEIFARFMADIQNPDTYFRHSSLLFHELSHAFFRNEMPIHHQLPFVKMMLGNIDAPLFDETGIRKEALDRAMDMFDANNPIDQSDANRIAGNDRLARYRGLGWDEDSNQQVINAAIKLLDTGTYNIQNVIDFLRKTAHFRMMTPENIDAFTASSISYMNKSKTMTAGTEDAMLAIVQCFSNALEGTSPFSTKNLQDFYAAAIKRWYGQDPYSYSDKEHSPLKPAVNAAISSILLKLLKSGDAHIIIDFDKSVPEPLMLPNRPEGTTDRLTEAKRLTA